MSVIQNGQHIPGEAHIVTDERYEPAADHLVFGYIDSVVCAGSTTEYGEVEGGCRKGCKRYPRDKAKTQAYCQINNLGGQMVEAAQDKDSKKAEALFQRVDDLGTQLGPQYRALFDALYDADPNSKDVQDILSMFESLDESCGH